MARPVTETAPIDLVEEAIHVLRGAGVRGLALIWTGAIPFAVGVLLFWRDMTHYDRNVELCAWESLLLVALLLWMNVLRGLFAASLHAQLAGAASGGNKGFFRTVGVHLVLGTSKLLLMPLAVLTVLAIPGAVGFFRIAITVAAVDGDDFSKTVAKARKLSSSVAQPVLLILLLVFIATLLFVNIAVLLALLPQLARILTGYESSFTRAGFRLLTDPSFYVAAGLMTWLAFEPLAQAVYTVAAFHAESKETGEDIRARLRALLRSSSVAALLVVHCALPLRAQPINASELDRSIHQTLASPQYAWNVQHEDTQEKESWFVRFTDALGAKLSKVRAAIGRAIYRLVEWFRKLFETPTSQNQGPPARGAIRGELYVALGLVLLVAAFLIWRGRAAPARKQIAAPIGPATVSLAADNVTADQLPEQGWYLLADECFSKGQLRLGLRALYLANLAGLAHERWIAIHPGKTDHEYETELHRRARAFPDACELFSANIVLFEQVWYGDYTVSLEHCQAFRDRAEQMKRGMASAEVFA
jgi:hypothetical protein